MKKEEQIDAYMIRSYDLSDTSIIVVWYSLELGVMKTVVKGAKAAKSTYAGRLEALSRYQVFFRRSRGDLHTLVDLEEVERYDEMRKSYDRFMLASYYCALIEHWVVGDQDNEPIFRLLHRAITYCDQKALEWRAVTYFEQELSKYLGYSVEPAEMRKLYQAPKLSKLRERIEQQIK